MKFREIEAFCAVMQSGSVAGAARLLAISAPAVSRMVRHTEDQLGYALFDRHAGRLVPTADAQVLYAAADEALGGMRRVTALAQAIGKGAPGLLRIAANPSFGASLLPAAPSSFAAETGRDGWTSTPPPIRPSWSACCCARPISG